MLSKSQVQAILSSLPFQVSILGAWEFMAHMGYAALSTRACFTQLLRPDFSVHCEAILFNGAYAWGDLENVTFQRTLLHELAHATGTPDRLARRTMDAKSGARHDPRMRCIEELTAERAAQKAMTYLGIYSAEDKKESDAYIMHYLGHMERNGAPLSEIEAHGIERDSDRALDFILREWASGIETARKAA